MDPPEHSLQAGQVLSFSAKEGDLLVFCLTAAKATASPIKVAAYRFAGNRRPEVASA
jgi:hypothetical protein